MKEALIGGALLGIVCVVGAYIRSGSTASPGFVFSLWYNRVIISLAVGAPWKERNRSQALLRGGASWTSGFLWILQRYRISRSYKFCGWDFVWCDN